MVGTDINVSVIGNDLDNCSKYYIVSSLHSYHHEFKNNPTNMVDIFNRFDGCSCNNGDEYKRNQPYWYMRDTTLMLSTVSILDAISDKKTLNIFNFIASSDSKSDILISKLELTKKQYYSRMSRLVQTGLTKRQQGRYLLTAFGKVIHNAEMNFEIRIEDALENYWKLKAIDSLQMPSVMGEEREKIISELIDSEEIRNVLMKVEESNLHTRTEVKKTHNVDQSIGLTLPNCP